MQTFEPKTILVPTDFSDLATHALDYASLIAQSFGSEITLLYADTFLPPPYFTMTQVDEVATTIERSKQAAREQLESYARAHAAPGVAVETVVVEELPVPAVTKIAEERDVDLIVMGTHGRSGLSRMMLGSVTERVLRETDRPVLTARKPEGSEASACFRRILCPVNFTEVARGALEHAITLSERLGAELYLLHVIEKDRGVDAEDEMKKICHWVPDEVRVRCHFEEVPMGSEPAEQIIRYAQSNGCDLMVIGAQHKRFSDATIIGATTVRIVRHAPVPVLTVIRKEEATVKAA